MHELSMDPRQQQLFWAKVRKAEGCWEWQGTRSPKGYGRAVLKIAGQWKLRQAHRIAYIDVKGPIPDTLVIDHLCHNPCCVNPDHLRATSHKGNQENRAGANRNSKSGVRGVCWDKQSGKWKVQVGHAGRIYRGGFFDNLSSAEAAAIELRASLHAKAAA